MYVNMQRENSFSIRVPYGTTVGDGRYAPTVQHRKERNTYSIVTHHMAHLIIYSYEYIYAVLSAPL